MKQPESDQAEDCAKLIYMAGPNFFRYLFARDQAEMQELLVRLFNKAGTAYSKEYIAVAEENGAVTGLALAFPARDAARLEMKVVGELLRIKPRYALGYLYRGRFIIHSPHLHNDELYVGYLAVLPAYRGRGVAGKLLAHAEAEAREKKLGCLSLFVEADNRHAKQVYERYGFVETAYKEFPKKFHRFGMIGFWKMVKRLA